MKKVVSILLWVSIVALLPPHTHAWQGFRDDFEGSEPTWREPADNAPQSIAVHRRTSQGARSGNGCEYVELNPDASEARVHLALDVPRAGVVAEMRASVWVRANVPGVQIMARIVLPRTVDPTTGEPISRYLGGSNYSSVGHWQELALSDLEKLLSQHARVLRSQSQSRVDMREAYIDQILLEFQDSDAPTRVWIDDLELESFVPVGEARRSWTREGVSLASATNTAVSAAVGAPLRRVELSGQILLVDGRPFFPRAIEYRGEPLDRLKQLRFNVVCLRETASEALLTEAAREKLWVVCPPPRPAGLDNEDVEPAALASFDARYDPVLAWDLGRGLSSHQLEATRRWAECVHRADARAARPLIAQPDEDLKGFSRVADVLLVGRFAVGTSLELADYATWLRERPRLARPGTPIWVLTQTEFSKAWRDQVALLSGGRAHVPALALEHLELPVQLAIAAGARGLVFTSGASLDAEDAATRERSRAMELINLGLDLIEPFAATGKPVATVSARDDSGALSGVRATLVQTPRARLLLPMWIGPGAQFVPDQSAAHSVKFLVPGIPESNDAYELTPAGLRRLNRQRKAGGTVLTLDEFALCTAVVLTDDARAVSGLTTRMTENGSRAAHLIHDIAAQKLQLTEKVHGELNRITGQLPRGASWLARARSDLRESESRLNQGDLLGAYTLAQRAMRPLRLLQRSDWEPAAASLGSPLAGPLSASYATLPWHLEFAQQSKTATPQRVCLQASFDDLSQTLASGWRLFEHPQSGISAQAELSATQAHRGAACLRLVCTKVGPLSAGGLVESAPLWIDSPSIEVQAGELLRIRVWIHVPTAVTRSVDGLLIMDSITGESLAERVGQTAGWQQFTLYRAAATDGELNLSIALTGVGEAWVDDVVIDSLSFAPRSAANQRGTSR